MRYESLLSEWRRRTGGGCSYCVEHTQTLLCNVATHSCYVAIRIDLVDLDLPVSTCTWNVEHVQQCRSTRSSSRSNDADDYLRRSIIGIILF